MGTGFSPRWEQWGGKVLSELLRLLLLVTRKAELSFSIRNTSEVGFQDPHQGRGWACPSSLPKTVGCKDDYKGCLGKSVRTFRPHPMGFWVSLDSNSEVT